MSAYAPIGLHFHWQAPGYLMLFVPLGAAAARGLASGNGHARRWLVSSAVVTAAMLAAVTTHTATGWWRTLGPTWWSAKMGQSEDPTLEALDWTELPEAMRSRGLLGREDMFVFSLRWFQSGKADYALKGLMPVLCLHPERFAVLRLFRPPGRLGRPRRTAGRPQGFPRQQRRGVSLRKVLRVDRVSSGGSHSPGRSRPARAAIVPVP